jgi:hypothetical protein
MLKSKSKAAPKDKAAGKPSKLPIPRRAPAAETFKPAKARGSAKGDKLAKTARASEPAVVQPPTDAEPTAAEAAPAATDAPTTVASPTAGKLSCLDAAAEVLRTAAGPMRVRELVAAMAAGGLWTSAAPTPHQTLASALLREIARKGQASRFRRADRGRFALAAKPA